MDWWLLTFFIGAILSLFLPEVPALFQLFILLCLAIGFYYDKKSRSSAGLWFGALCILTQAYLYHNQLPRTVLDLMQKKQSFFVEGNVLSLNVTSPQTIERHSIKSNTVKFNTEINKTSKNVAQKKLAPTKRFNFRVHKVNQQLIDSPFTIRLSWQKPSIDVFQGDVLSLKVKLKPVHGLANIGTFNYLSWLKVHNISATGYVVKPKKNNRKMNTEQTPQGLNDNKLILENTSVRQQLFAQYQQLGMKQSTHQGQGLVTPHELTPILLALAFGERSTLDATHWQVLQATGTSHLIAISGLHVGLLAGGAFFIVRLFFKYIPLKDPRWQYIHIHYLAIAISVVFATFYAYLAGFSLPTQRALVMLNLYWFSRLMGIKFSPKRLLLITLFILLMISPFSLFTASFWLSFYAVAIIFLSLWRFKYWLSNGTAIWRFFKGLLIIQVTLTLMLMPITALFFQQVSLISFVANIVAVPWMSAVSIPTALLSVLLMPLSESLAQWCMMLSLQSLSWLWYYLELLSQQEYAIISLSFTQQIIVLIAGVTVFFIIYLAPLCLRHSVKQGTFVLLSLLLTIILLCKYPLSNSALSYFALSHSNLGAYFLPKKSNKLTHDVAYSKEHHFTPWQVVFFDVGQGLSVLIKRNDHAILYDTGAAYPSGFVMSDAVIVPYLHYVAIDKLDKVILSHSDNDHAGGLDYLLKNLFIDEIMSNDSGITHLLSGIATQSATQLDNINIAQKSCNPQQSFIWQGLAFDILWPISPHVIEQQSTRVKQKNDDSCVILISDLKGRKLLLTGDISAKVEQQLITLYPQLTADILQVPHHGSKTSSSQAFLQQLSPNIAIVSAGYLNRWKMPVAVVSQRYQDLNIPLLNSAVLGQIIITFEENDISTKNYVEDLRPFWFSH
ncbi:MAG: DNA internalization-related competence protein ComEC/Rec2 [Colwellia sp.]